MTNFCAAYNSNDCQKQRCLVHLLCELSKKQFQVEPDALRAWLNDRWRRASLNKDCLRIYKCPRRRRDELLTFLDQADAPPDNNAAERDSRSVGAA